MRSEDNARRTSGIVRISVPALSFVLIVSCARRADAYIDPGTGGTMFSALAPLLGVIGIVFIATLGVFRTYVRLAVAFIWRHRCWAAGAVVGLIAGVAFFVAQQESDTSPYNRAPKVRPRRDNAEEAPGQAGKGPRESRKQTISTFTARHDKKWVPTESSRLSRAGTPPNVIVYSIEALRRDHLSLYGYWRETSPFLEELAREAIVFEHAYSQSSWTRPSVATMLTGLYPSQHQALVVMDRLRDSVILLPEILRERGHVTAGFCTGSLITSPSFNYAQGFDLFVDKRQSPAGTWLPKVLEWLDNENPTPFFVFIHTFDPHDPYAAPDTFRDIFDPGYEAPMKSTRPIRGEQPLDRKGLSSRDVDHMRASYDAEILYSDAMLREFTDGLKERDLWDNTLLVVTSDHGQELNEHGHWGHKRNLFPEKLGIPLVIKLPGQEHGGLRLGGLASGVDLVPTILAALDIPAPADLPGVNLLGSMETGETGRDYHFAEFWAENRSNYVGNPDYSVISQRFQYIATAGARKEDTGKEYLFDLIEDPTAQKNLADSRPEIRMKFARMIRERYRQSGYTIAANGGGKPLRFSGIARAEAPIVELEGIRTESDDSFELDQDKKTLRFELTVTGDDDLLRFQTDPANAPVSIDIERRGEASPPTVYLGPRRERCEQLPLKVPARRCVLDTDFGLAPDYVAGQDAGLYIWRQGTSHAQQEKQVEPDEDTLKTLKDLGYL